MIARALLACSLVGALGSPLGCKPKPEDIIVPGKTKDVKLVVKVAGLSGGELASIGSFTMTAVVDGKDDGTFALNYSASSDTLAFLDDPPALPATGTLSFRFVGNDLGGAPLPVGGSTRTLDLDQIPRGGDATLFAVIGHSDGFDDLGAPLIDARFGFTASGAGTGFVVVGGYTDGTWAAPGQLATTAEWHDLATGVTCASNGGAACSFGDVPPPRVDHIAVALGDFFGPACADNDAVLVGLGVDDGGVAKNDLYVFRPSRVVEGGEGGFERLDLEGVVARANATAFGTADCRVIITGGANGATALTSTEVLTFGPGGVEHSGGPSLVSGRVGALAAPTGNALGEVVVVGGIDSADAPVGSAATFATSQGALDLCDSGDDDCNGAASLLECARGRPALAPLAAVSDDFPTLVVGGDVAGAGCGPAEVLVSRADEPYTRFIGVGGNALADRDEGHAAVAFGRGRALVAGGLSDQADPAAVELVSVTSVGDASAQLSVSTFPIVPPFGGARAGLAFARVGGAVLLIGGVEGAPVANVYVAVPEAP